MGTNLLRYRSEAGEEVYNWPPLPLQLLGVTSVCVGSRLSNGSKPVVLRSS